MDRFYIICAAGIMFIFFAANGVWTSIDGKDRPGSGLFEDNGVFSALTSIPNPFKADPSTYLLPELPEADGWTRTALADPWTERPIKADGTIPTDAELPAIILRESSEYAPNSFRIAMNGQVLEDRRARMNGAKRAGAHYASETAALIVMVERLRDETEHGPRTPLGEALHDAAARVGDSLDRLSVLVPSENFGGIAFRKATPQSRGTQTEMRGNVRHFEADLENYLIRVWGSGSLEEMDALVTEIAPALHAYTQAQH